MKNKIFIGIILSLISLVLGYYFYITAFAYETVYVSDLNQHIRVSQLLFNPEFYTENYLPHIEGYLLFHIVIKVVSLFTNGNYELSSAIVLSLSCILTILIVIFYWSKLLKRKLKNDEIFLIILLIFVAGLPLLGKLYLPQGTPTPWHNPTLLFSRPFAIVSFFSFYNLLINKNNKIPKIEMFIFSVSTILSCYAKPSFVFVFISTAGIIVLINILADKFKCFKWAVNILLLVTPTLILLLYQYTLSFSNNLTMIIRFGSFLRLDLISVIIASLAVLAFPIIHLLTNYKKIKYKVLLIMGYSTFLMGWMQQYFLDVKEFSYGDFSWGYFISIFLLYLVTLIDLKGHSVKTNILTYAIYIIQFFFGVIYLIKQMNLEGFLL